MGSRLTQSDRRSIRKARKKGRAIGKAVGGADMGKKYADKARKKALRVRSGKGRRTGGETQKVAAEGSRIGAKKIGESARLTGSDTQQQQAQTAVTEGRMEALKGFDSKEMTAMRDTAQEQIGQQTETARRQLMAAQGRAGVRGATAASQQMGVIEAGQQASKDFERDLLLRQRDAQQQALGNLEQNVQFDIDRKAKEKFGAMAYGLGLAGLSSAEKQAKLATKSQERAAEIKGGGGGGTVICTELNRQGLVSDKLRLLTLKHGLKLDDKTYFGYLKWATPVVELMTKSAIFTSFVAIFAIPAINHIASLEDNTHKSTNFGKIVYNKWKAFSRFVGRNVKKVVYNG